MSILSSSPAIAKLQAALKLSGTPEKGLLEIPEAILLTVEMLELLAEPARDEQTVTPGADGAYYTLHTVPTKEIWIVYVITAERLSGDTNIDRLAIGNPAGNLIPIDSFTAGTVRITRLDQPLVLEAGWTVQARRSGGATAGTFSAIAYYRRLGPS